MTIKIGDKSLATAVTDKAKADLIAATGCSTEEHVAQLQRGANSSHVARALHPFLKEPIGLPQLAALIEGDVPSAREQVLTLLAPPADAPAKASAA